MHSHSPSWFVLSSKATADIRHPALIPAVVFTALAVFMVMLRWYSRVVYSSPGSIGTEDYFLTAALLMSIGITCVVGGEFSVDGSNLHRDQAEPSSLPTMLKLVFAQSILYHLSVNLVKASFTLQYLRLFSLIPSIVYSCYILLVIILGAAAWGIFGVVFLCAPVQSYWNVTVSGTCKNAENNFWSTSIIGIVLDCAIWVLPIPVVGGLRLPRRQKIGLLIVFGMGCFVCIVSILRLVIVHDAAHRHQVTKSGTYALIFSTIEVNVSIICASLLVMKPLFARFLPAVVFEQPMSAREDRQLWRGMTGLHLLDGAAAVDVEKAEDDGRRDTAIGMISNAGRLVPSENSGNSRRSG
ncbi:Nn.00g079890.m01.CDS01 [Neocucurbitaria sp. VM-36]